MTRLRVDIQVIKRTPDRLASRNVSTFLEFEDGEVAESFAITPIGLDGAFHSPIVNMTFANARILEKFAPEHPQLAQVRRDAYQAGLHAGTQVGKAMMRRKLRKRLGL